MPRRAMALMAATLVATGGGELAAQSLAQRVAAVRNGTVRLEYAADEGVCGNGRGNISIKRGSSRTVMNGGTRGREWEDECEPGPVRLALDVERGEVTEIRSYVGGRWRGTADADLGTVPAAEASEYLLALAESGSDRVAKEAIFPAMIADGPEPWQRLLRLAKDDRRSRSVRESAVFWVGQGAAEEATKGLQEIVDDPDGNRDVRKSAVFALSQRPKDESVPALLRIARTHKDPDMRRSAIFWLGQSKDPRAIAYFEEVLTGK